MRFNRQTSTRQAAVTVAVLLLHLALVWVFLRPLFIPAPQEDPNSIQATILPLVRSNALGDTLPQIKPQLRTPQPEIPKSALEVSIELPVDQPAVAEPLSPSVIPLTPAQAPALPLADSGTPARSKGAAGDSLAAAGFVLVRSVQPVYPRRSITLGEQGDVLLAVTLNNQGQPVDAKVLQSSRFERLDQAALLAARKWRFKLPASPPGGRRQIAVHMGFHLATWTLGLQASVVQFNAQLVTHINDLARLTPAPAAPSVEEVRQIIGRVTEAENLGHAAAGLQAAPQTHFHMTKTDVAALPLPSPGSLPARITGSYIDPSAVLHIQLIGAVMRDQNGDIVQADPASQDGLWYVFALRQEHGTSEWLLAVDSSGVSYVEVIAGGPPCTLAPESVICAAAETHPPISP